MNVDIAISNQTDVAFEEGYERLICDMIKLSLQYEGFAHDCEVSVTIADNALIKQLNQKYRKKDQPTDVLSFPMMHFTAGKYDLSPAGHYVMLGDIVISFEKAAEQAALYGHSLKRELAFLTAHSVLHLLGYDHLSANQQKIMFEKQAQILTTAGVSR